MCLLYASVGCLFRNMSQQYSFPILETSEIVQCLNELNIEITKKDLKKPEPAVVRNVYQHLVELLLGWSAEDHKQIDFDMLDELEFAEMHEESMVEYEFNRAL
eukprot:TRINITY_DN2328_c0_g1_i1.p1 TRINITY_DN2328_c0_g1~~TRINITY_DN2328_c0_g1_i1.p1  ORF type:complete len:103 (-),score=40.73 TRINITY_DN2328_c0_g1_i1:114-422(-)